MTIDTPRTDAVDIDDAAINYKRLCRQLERELAEAHRVIAWLRGGYHYGKVWVNGFGEESVRLSDVHDFLASSPPVEWKTPHS